MHAPMIRTQTRRQEPCNQPTDPDLGTPLTARLPIVTSRAWHSCRLKPELDVAFDFLPGHDVRAIQGRRPRALQLLSAAVHPVGRLRARQHRDAREGEDGLTTTTVRRSARPVRAHEFRHPCRRLRRSTHPGPTTCRADHPEQQFRSPCAEDFGLPCRRLRKLTRRKTVSAPRDVSVRVYGECVTDRYLKRTEAAGWRPSATP